MAAAPPEYRAGAAAGEHVRVVVLEDRRGARAVFAEADFAITRAMSDLVAVQLVKNYDLDRAGIVVSGTRSGVGRAADVVSVVEDAVAKIGPAAVAFSDVISVRTADGACVATLYPVRLDGCREGVAVHGPIRAAFQMMDVPHGLQTREASSRAYPVQAIAIGKVTVLALGGDVPLARFAAAGRVVVPFANDVWSMPDGFSAAIEGVLKRIR
jgi:Tfp pilus assembly ATPase PilU